MAEARLIAGGLTGRYARALFDLAQERGVLADVEASLGVLSAALAESEDLRRLTTSPRIERAAAAKGVAAVSKSLQLDQLTANFLGVLAENRRLSQLSGIIRDFRRLIADARGETTAEVTSATPLSDAQMTALKDKLRIALGQDVAIEANVDPSLLGGLVVRVGSRMIDSSIRTKLNNLTLAMKA